MVREAFKPESLPQFTFVPVPPSKARGDPEYDDRLVRALNSGTPALDVRELLVMKTSTRSHHEYEPGEKRPTPDEMYALLELDVSQLSRPIRPILVLFDDLITNGTHFAACKRIIREKFPEQAVIGLFIGRRKPPEPFEIDISGLLD